MPDRHFRTRYCSLNELSAQIRLRPTRVGLLVGPNDKASIRRFMRVCSCMWGGIYNPIIPVFRNTPEEWRSKFRTPLRGIDVTKGYLEFFEPDILVEAREGNVARAGISLNQHWGSRNHIISLDELLRAEPNRDHAELTRGLSIIDVYREKYSTERKFELRDGQESLLVKPVQKTLAVEAIFGAFPKSQESKYFEKGYSDVYQPKVSDFSVETWRSVFMEGALAPLQLTKFKLNTDRSWQHDLKIFVFDPSRVTDIIDLWNMRLEPWPIIPIPILWWKDLLEDAARIVKFEHRPLQGNPHGMMHDTTIEFSRSIDEHTAKKLATALPNDLPKRSLALKLWRNEVWRRTARRMMPVERPLRITAAEKREMLKVDKRDKPIVEFRPLSPSFASQFGGALSARWVNAVKLSSFHDNEFATVLPFNSTTSNWIRIDLLGGHVVVGSEGWVFSQNYKDMEQAIELSTPEDAVVQWMQKSGFEAKPSEPGHIAKQVLRQLGGTWGFNLLKDEETLKFLNGMAGGIRTRRTTKEIEEEQFDPKTRSANDWVGLMKRRDNRRTLSKVDIKHFTDRNILSLGLSSNCPTCTAKNWHSLSDVDFRVRCARCLESYSFPQGELSSKNGNFGYRVIGPFATPDYARGSYATLLTYNLLNGLGLGHHNMTFAPGIDLRLDDASPPCEVDFIAWRSREHHGETLDPDLLIGETKSFGKGDLIKDEDVARLKKVAGYFPGAIIVCSVLRDHFSDKEKARLSRLVHWARRPNQDCEPTNPVVLLTGNELFFDINLGATWKALGDPHAKFDDFNYTSKIRGLSDATQEIYLELSNYYEDNRYRKRRSHRKL